MKTLKGPVSPTDIQALMFTYDWKQTIPNADRAMAEMAEFLKPATPPASPAITLSLVPNDYLAAAAKLGVPTATLKAVVSVEAQGRGFLSDGRAKCLFEAHWFHRFTKGRYQFSHPHLSSPTWNPKLYYGGTREWQRVNEALALNESAAMLSTSLNLFQIMGFNWKLCGYTSVEDYFNAMQVSENASLNAFCKLITKQRLVSYLRECRWIDFAYHYNGAGYRRNKYDTKLAAAYQQFGGI
ncbi:N-acetylmuramidase family protein [Candidatus Cyanaurora vandensis]|uniref:N-acetylmuramidase family protein n=1 Tax=Candidatus Cyanaurora vandensis TaxID=2714958 RepID=UPI00257D8E70|nr:N-acetylmuramidase family protein [Candidatus Cyanaurora vandensis]